MWRAKFTLLLCKLPATLQGQSDMNEFLHNRTLPTLTLTKTIRGPDEASLNSTGAQHDEATTHYTYGSTTV